MYEVTSTIPRCTYESFTVLIPYDLVPDNDIFEMFCSETKKDRIHMVK